jgi:LysW-gamma-L-alpha-aminoadipyl-6-phosphate/LysW-L-glutamyl-5-phosphate reductase
MSRPIRAAILGARGYGAGELLRLFTQHSAVEVVSVTSSSQVGRQVAAVHPHLRGFYDLKISAAIDWPRLLEAEHAVVFSALPHGTSGTTLDRLLNTAQEQWHKDTLKVVDLSGDLRLRDIALHRTHYPESAELPGRRGEFVYGLPELARGEIRRARCVANPGCLAATSILAAAPACRLPGVQAARAPARAGDSSGARRPARRADRRELRGAQHGRGARDICDAARDTCRAAASGRPAAHV